MSSNHNNVQASCTGFEFALGDIHALRQFSIQGLELTSVIQTGVAWQKHMEAKCEVGTGIDRLTYELRVKQGLPAKMVKKHTSTGTEYVTYTQPNPCSGLDPNCTCGLYAYHDIAAMDANSYANARLFGVVRAYGKTIVGTKGIRAEKADIVALCGIVDKNQQVRRISGTQSYFDRELSVARDSYRTIQQSVASLKLKLDLTPVAPTNNTKLQSLYGWLAVFFGVLIPVLLVTSFIVSIPLLVTFASAPITAFFASCYFVQVDRASYDSVRERNKTAYDSAVSTLKFIESHIKNLEKMRASATPDTYIPLATQYRLSHDIGRRIAKRYGVPYYETREEMLAAHPLTGKEALGIQPTASEILKAQRERRARELELRLQALKDFGF